MVSSKALTWTVALFELVVSCAAMLGSLSIVCAQLQSTSIYDDKQSPRFHVFKPFFKFSQKLWAGHVIIMGRSSVCPHQFLSTAQLCYPNLEGPFPMLRRPRYFKPPYITSLKGNDSDGGFQMKPAVSLDIGWHISGHM